MIHKLMLKVMIGLISPSQPRQQLVLMVEVVVLSIESGQDLDRLVLDVETHLDVVAVI